MDQKPGLQIIKGYERLGRLKSRRITLEIDDAAITFVNSEGRRTYKLKDLEIVESDSSKAMFFAEEAVWRYIIFKTPDGEIIRVGFINVARRQFGVAGIVLVITLAALPIIRSSGVLFLIVLPLVFTKNPITKLFLNEEKVRLCTEAILSRAKAAGVYKEPVLDTMYVNTNSRGAYMMRYVMAGVIALFAPLIFIFAYFILVLVAVGTTANLSEAQPMWITVVSTVLSAALCTLIYYFVAKAVYAYELKTMTMNEELRQKMNKFFKADVVAQPYPEHAEMNGAALIIVLICILASWGSVALIRNTDTGSLGGDKADSTVEDSAKSADWYKLSSESYDISDKFMQAIVANDAATFNNLVCDDLETTNSLHVSTYKTFTYKSPDRTEDISAYKFFEYGSIAGYDKNKVGYAHAKYWAQSASVDPSLPYVEFINIATRHKDGTVCVYALTASDDYEGLEQVTGFGKQVTEGLTVK